MRKHTLIRIYTSTHQRPYQYKEDKTICGIVYSKSFTDKDVTNTVLKRFENQRGRGTTSFGFYLPEKDKLVHNVKEGRIKSLLKRTVGENKEVLFHHRFSTSTVDVRNACHPFSTKDYFENQYIGVHNGMISNDDKLLTEHRQLGINYISTQPNGTFNDSEALVYDLARYFEGETSQLTAEGSIAFIMVKRDKAGKPVTLFFGRNSGNPLKMKKTKHSLTLSSEGEGEDIPMNTLHMFDYDTGELRTRYLHIPTTTYSYVGNYGSKYSTNASSTTYDDADYDAYWDRRYKSNLLSSSQLDLEGYNQLRDETFAMRSGTAEEIKAAILEENLGSLKGAMYSAENEYEQSVVEMTLLDRTICSEEDDETQIAIVDYWVELDDYSKVMKGIADQFYAEAKAQDAEINAALGEREDSADKQLGFHSNRRTVGVF